MSESSHPPVYLVVASEAVGGAEKRFVGLWSHMRDRGANWLSLVTTPSLERHLRSSEEFARPLATYRDGLIVIEPPQIASTLSRAFRKSHDAVFHYTFASPLLFQRFVSRRTVYTIPNSSLAQYNMRGRAVVWASAILAGRVDVLDPTVARTLRRRLFLRGSAISNTPGSFVDGGLYRPGRKRNLLVFCGLFHPEKQAHRLAATLPAVTRRLAELGIENPEFAFLGRDADRVPLADVVNAAAIQGTVRVGYEPNPAGVLECAKVFFSLQRTTNYPSKSLLEAMACGCVPIVTDVGSTRRIAQPEFAEFVPRDFEPEDIARAAGRILTLNDDAFQGLGSLARAYALTNFSAEAMATYYAGIYDSFNESGNMSPTAGA